MVYKYINRTDEIWGKILPLLPKDKNNKEEEKLILVNSVFYLQDCQRKNNEKYSLQLHWDRLDNNVDNILDVKKNMFKEKSCIDNNTLRRKFDDWRNNGVWERLLPIFAEYSKYFWITEEGRYEVFLICSKFIRDRNIEQIKDVRHQCKEELKEKEEKIRQENIKLKQYNKYLQERIAILDGSYRSRIKQSNQE